MGPAVSPRSRAAWAALSPGYRNRLVRQLGGGDVAAARQAFLRGDPLGRARGHAAASEHRGRVERGLSRGLTRSQASGLPRPGEPGAARIGRSFVAVPVRLPGGTTRLVDLEPRNAGAASRLGSYENDLRLLLDGRLPPADFASRWRGRRVAGRRLEDRPARAVEVLRQQSPPPGVPRYRRAIRPAVAS